MKRKLFAISLICVFMLTGCTKAIELTEDQDALVAEAAAGVLVRNSYKYKSKYSDYNYKNKPQEATAEPESQTPEETEQETDASGKDEKTLMLSTASKALGIEPAEVSFKECKIVDEYPDDPDALFTAKPEDGFKFIVAVFNIHNPDTASMKINTVDNKTLFRLTANKMTVNNFATLLTNDITRLSDVEIKPGGDYEAVAVFMVSEEVAASYDKLRVSYVYEHKSYGFNMK